MAENTVICIARQFGSGGHHIGRTLAKQLGIAFYDKELLKQAAEKSGILPELFEKNDEKPASGLTSAFAYNSVDEKMSDYAAYAAYLPNDRIQNAIADTIRDVAEHSSCVIIGRCADYILRGRQGTFSVFVWAPLEARIQRIARTHNLEEDAARALIRKTDRSRANYYAFYTDRDWASAESYDLSINSGRLGLEKTVDLVAQVSPFFGG
ncbi:cytidylate kinase-like family protein [Ruminococcaceae bacterium OttesenSCG-928-A16]|nr:cytidylate kinase-like family protein [Ruminococcaceae bacterium OttesenSCG-928-A16]